jgi:hypothetical protein
VDEQRANGKIAGARRRAWLTRRNGRNGEPALPLDVRLRAIGERIEISEIDELWVFPPLPDRDGAAEFIVLSCYDGPGRRRVVTAHVEPQRDEQAAEEPEITWVQRLHEHGAAPEDWVSGIPDRLLQRLSEAGVPRVVEIGGQPERWVEAIDGLTGGNGAHGNATAADGRAPNRVDSAGPAGILLDADGVV